MKKALTRARNNKGMSTVVLMLFLAFFVILPLGLLGFEITRSILIQQELRNITDSAALSGTAAMASAPEYDLLGNPTTYQQRQVIAMQTAIQTFEFNSILGTPFGVSNVTGNQNPMPPSPQTPGLHQAILNVILLDQTGTQVATGIPAATLTVQAYYTDAPIFVSKILPIQNQFTVQATSNGGLPQLDVILCLDVSGSMDDQTNIWFVNRYWDPNTLKMVYKTNVTSSTGKAGRGNMFTVLGPPNTGTTLNVYPPQYLASATYVGANANTNGFTWSETPDAAGFVFSTLKGLRSNTVQYGAGPANMPEQGMPPGNYDKTNPANLNYRGLGQPAVPPNPPTIQDGVGGFTDMVCDMGFPTTINGYTFSSVQTAVEAARGNMESLPILKAACGGSQPASITDAPRAGYFDAYQTWVLQNATPISTARQAAYNFFNTMNLSANCHFGLVCFSTTPGTAPGSVFPDTNNNLNPGYAPGGTGIFPNPLIAISQSNTSAQEFTAVTTALDGTATAPPLTYNVAQYPIRAEGSTDIAEALKEALDELTNAADVRPTAKKAVVLFTDGIPNKPVDTPTGTTQALAQGTRAGSAGVNIPVYTIGLSANPNLQGQELALLGDSASNPGIAYKSGNNAIYVPVANGTQLDAAFQTIARSLCAIK